METPNAMVTLCNGIKGADIMKETHKGEEGAYEGARSLTGKVLCMSIY